MRDRIIVDKSLIPYSFDIVLSNEVFSLSFSYNESGDLFTVSLYKDGELIVTEPIVYGQPLFADVYKPNKYPAERIVPIDESGNENKVTFDNFGTTVFLVIDDTEESV